VILAPAAHFLPAVVGFPFGTLAGHGGRSAGLHIAIGYQFLDQINVVTEY